MIAKDLVVQDIIPLKISDTGNSALNRMMEYNVHHLPVVEEKIYKGMIAEYDLMDMDYRNETIGELTLENERINVNVKDHLFDIVKKMNQYGTSAIPVVDDEGHYVGLIQRDGVLERIANINAFKDPGGIIVLEMNTSDYSMGEVAQIIESEGARILATYVETSPDSKKMTLTLKLNKVDLNTIIATFERYSYEIKASYGEETFDDYLQERYDSLMKYLKI